jgi:hypothetical protein
MLKTEKKKYISIMSYYLLISIIIIDTIVINVAAHYHNQIKKAFEEKKEF